MTQSTRAELFARLESDIRAAIAETGTRESDAVDIEVFFADELLFVSATQRAADGSMLWRSSHAATPDSTSIADLRAAGDDLIARVAEDAALAQAVEGPRND